MHLVVDVETTGIETDDKIVSIGILNLETKEAFYEVVNEGKKISPKASSLHNITNEERKKKFALSESESYEYLQKHNNSKHTLVAHNLGFTLSMLEKSGFSWLGESISTQRVTKHLIPECDDFSLQVLLYELQLYKQKEKEYALFGIKDALHAHHALGDTIIIKLLFDYLQEMESIERLVQLTQENVLINKFDFGKYKGQFIEEIAYTDKNYLAWVVSNVYDLDEDMKYSIDYYLQGTL